MIRSISAVDAATTGAGLASVVWVDEDHRYASQARLVADEQPQLKERPVRESGTLAATGRNPLADTLKVFQGNRAGGALRLYHDLLADLMVGVSLIAGLLAADKPKLPSRCAGSLPLEVAATVGECSTLLLDRCAAVGRAVRVRGEVHDAEVYSDHVGRFDRLTLRHIADDGEVERPSDIQQGDFTSVGRKQPALVVPADERYRHPAIECPQVDHALANKAEDTPVVGLPGATPKVSLPRTPGFVCIGNLSNATNGSLPAESKVFTSLTIGDVVQIELPEGLFLPRECRDIVTGGVGGL